MSYKEVMSMLHYLYYYEGFKAVTIDIEDGHVMLMAECELQDDK